MSLPLLHREIPVVDRAAQLLGVTAAAGLAGVVLGMSASTVPALLEGPASVAIKQWRKIYESGKVTAPPTTVLIASLFGYLAWRERNISTTTMSLYAGAAVLAPSIMPYTIAIMSSTNDDLIQRSESTVEIASRDESTKALIDRWATLNLVRSVLLFTSAALGAWASLNPVQTSIIVLRAMIAFIHRKGSSLKIQEMPKQPSTRM